MNSRHESFRAVFERGRITLIGGRKIKTPDRLLLSRIVVGDTMGVHLALIAGANPNEVDERGYTALHLAVDYRKLDVIPILIGHGASVELKNPEGDDALEMAAGRDDIEMLEVIDRARKEESRSSSQSQRPG